MWDSVPYRLELQCGTVFGYCYRNTDKERILLVAEKQQGSGRPTIGAMSAAVLQGSEPHFPNSSHTITKPGASEFSSLGSPEFLRKNQGYLFPPVNPRWGGNTGVCSGSLGSRNDARKLVEFTASGLLGVKVPPKAHHPVPGKMTHGSKSPSSRRCSHPFNNRDPEGTTRRKDGAGQEITVWGLRTV
jgi:hypothetical protein